MRWGIAVAGALMAGLAHAQSDVGFERSKNNDYEVLVLVHFKLGSAELDDKAKTRLDDALPKLAARTEPVEVSGHTDESGAEAVNENLSLQRAQAVTSYLVEKGIPPKRLSPVGHGHSQPIASNDTKWGRWRNRRVELRIPG